MIFWTSKIWSFTANLRLRFAVWLVVPSLWNGEFYFLELCSNRKSFEAFPRETEFVLLFKNFQELEMKTIRIFLIAFCKFKIEIRTILRTLFGIFGSPLGIHFGDVPHQMASRIDKWVALCRKWSSNWILLGCLNWPSWPPESAPPWRCLYSPAKPQTCCQF